MNVGEAESVGDFGDGEVGVDQTVAGGSHFCGEVGFARALSIVLFEQLAEVGWTESVLSGELFDVQFFVAVQLNLLHGIFDCLGVAVIE